jgi:hypothetical protein
MPILDTPTSHNDCDVFVGRQETFFVVWVAGNIVHDVACIQYHDRMKTTIGVAPPWTIDICLLDTTVLQNVKKCARAKRNAWMSSRSCRNAHCRHILYLTLVWMHWSDTINNNIDPDATLRQNMSIYGNPIRCISLTTIWYGGACLDALRVSLYCWLVLHAHLNLLDDKHSWKTIEIEAHLYFGTPTQPRSWTTPWASQA